MLIKTARALGVVVSAAALWAAEAPGAQSEVKAQDQCLLPNHVALVSSADAEQPPQRDLWPYGAAAAFALFSAAAVRSCLRMRRGVAALRNKVQRATELRGPLLLGAKVPRDVRLLSQELACRDAALTQCLAEQETQVQELRRDAQELRATLVSETEVRRAVEGQLRHDALHDVLTHLPNRQLFVDRLNYLVARAKRDESFRFAVLFLDLDNFKVVNDSLGHKAGDVLLVEVSRRLSTCLRGVDMVSRMDDVTTARLGGDEFVILLDGIRGEQDATLVAERIQEALAAPIQLEHGPHAVSASIGIALNDQRQRDAEELLRDADIAMYRAKRAGKRQYAVFDGAMHAAAKARLRLEHDMRRGLEQHEFELHYQPIVNLESGSVAGFEALLRWRHPAEGVLGPDRFLAVAEETGLMKPLGMWTMDEACRRLREWRAAKPDLGRLFINLNVSRRQLCDSAFVDHLREAMRAASIPADGIHLEVTESVLSAAAEQAPAVLEDLQSLGVGLVMDDFGGAHSTLSCLHRYRLQALKIDKTFIPMMGCCRAYAAIVHGIITLARNLQIEVIAAGIQTPAELAALITFDCEYGQGFHFSRPLPADEALNLAGKTCPWPRPQALQQFALAATGAPNV